MKMLKKALAVVLAIVFVLSLAACHPKDEVAVSTGDYTLTSAVYSYYLTMADRSAKYTISTSDSYNTQDPNFDLYKQTIDGKSYEDYVKAQALEDCYRYLTIAKLADEADVSLTDEEEKNVIGNADYYWSYQYGPMLGPVLVENGVSYDTYKKIMLTEALYSKYFDYLYAEGGTKEVKAEDIKKFFNDNYLGAYVISHSYSDVKDPKTEEIAKDLDKYVKALKDGKKFADVEAEYKKDHEKNDSTSSSSSTTSSGNSSTTSSGNSSTTSSDNSSTTSSGNSSTTSSGNSSTTTSSTTSSETKEDEKKPKDEKINVFTKNEDADTSYGIASTFGKYDEIAKLKNDEVALIHDEDAKSYYIVVKKDITEDEYYLEEGTPEILRSLKGDEYEDFVKETTSNLDFKVSKYAINQFKVKKIYDGSDLYY